MDVTHAVLIGAAAFAAGAVNAIAGGGSLITFPVLLASGLPAVTASMTNTVAMCPGYFGAVIAQRRDLAGQGSRAVRLVPLSLVGSLAGAWILLQTTEKSFQTIVPFLLVFAAGLLAAQGKLRRYLAQHTRGGHSMAFAILPVALSAIYGAYFGAGMGVIILAILAVVVDDTLLRANALKQLLSLIINTCAAVVFLFVGKVEWSVAAIIAVTSLIGGLVGGRFVTRIPEALLRWVAITVALAVAVVYFAKL
ncbi:MAG TPA: sulfite exporter TauE/SafE family protein [Kofleriaceae bacterium]|nr:sulfite exporter TauE/SafE family protein [Kofleriaceae bacterium]